MVITLLNLLLAALLEVGGDAAIRHGLLHSRWTWPLLGASALVAYGVVVNTNTTVDFGRLMGVYIAVFFLVSQVIGIVVFGERPAATLVLGGAMIVAGGAVVQLGMR